MKNLKTILALAVVFPAIALTSCDTDNDTESKFNTPEEARAKETAFLQQYPEKVNGTWKVEKMVLTTNTLSDIFKNDTILYNVGEISIEVEDLTRPTADRIDMIFNGTFHINEETVPFHSHHLLAFPDYNYAVDLIQVNTEYIKGVPVNQYPEDYKLLEGYFFGDNYQMELSEDGKTWTWEGLNRSAKEIILTKID